MKNYGDKVIEQLSNWTAEEVAIAFAKWIGEDQCKEVCQQYFLIEENEEKNIDNIEVKHNIEFDAKEIQNNLYKSREIFDAIVFCNCEDFLIHTTGTDYDFIAVIQNKTKDIMTLDFYDLDKTITIPPNDWVGILADEEGYVEYLQLKFLNFSTHFEKQNI